LPWNSYVDCFTGPVVTVPNGDTIEILHGNNPERICLNGIDCSEKHQAYGTRAEQATSGVSSDHFTTISFWNRRKDTSKPWKNRLLGS
jgi:endonuclease YncB( thermonuclease family)